MTATNIIPLDMPEPRRFVPPNLDECVSHGATIGLPAREATKFFHYNNARDWMLGKNRIKRWKSAIQIWRMNYSGTVQGVTRSNNPSRSDVLDYAKSIGDKEGYSASWYERRLATNFANPEALGWKELFIKDFTRHNHPTQTGKPQ